MDDMKTIFKVALCQPTKWDEISIFIVFFVYFFTLSRGVIQSGASDLTARARIHSQFESLGFVGKYDQSPTNIVNSWTLKYWGADFLQNPRIFSLQNGPRMRANNLLCEILCCDRRQTVSISCTRMTIWNQSEQNYFNCSNAVKNVGAFTALN
jgi:hypothetical protein